MPELASACQYPDKATSNLGLSGGNPCTGKTVSGLTLRMIARSSIR